jgi:signal transduction histidine kinase
MITDTRAAEAIEKPPSRLSSFGMNRTDWALFAIALLLGALALLSVIDTPQPEAVGVLARLAAPIGLVLAALGLVRTGNGLEASERRAWHAIAIGTAVYAMAVAVRSMDGLRLIEVDRWFVIALSSCAIVIITLGIFAIPRLSPIRYTRYRALMDAVAGSAAVGALVWELVRDRIELRVGLDAMVSTAAIGAYVFLVAAAVFAVMRHERYRSDRPFKILIVAAGVFVASGVATQLGGSADFELGLPVAADLVLATALAAAAIELGRTRKLRNSTIARLPAWKLAVPYVPVLLLVGVTFTGLLAERSDLGLLPFALVLVTVASGFSQVFAARENRELVGIERDQLITAVSHELRVPLTAVAGFSDVLAAGWDFIDESERGEMVEIIQNQSRYLTGMITDMSSLVRDQLHTVELDVRRLEGKKVIADAVRAVFDLDGGPLPVRAQVEPYLELIGDEQRLHQVLVSLLKNAQRYGGGRILIVAKREVDWRIIEVHDNGPGLSTRHEVDVWSRFQRGEHDLDAKLPGSGLGLSLVRSLAAAHGGAAFYRRSEKLGGACFVLRLPMERNAEIEREWLDPV